MYLTEIIYYYIHFNYEKLPRKYLTGKLHLNKTIKKQHEETTDLMET